MKPFFNLLVFYNLPDFTPTFRDKLTNAGEILWNVL